jgi:hypothetical protein
VVFRADGAFVKPEIPGALEEQGVKFAIRIPANESLKRDIVELLTRSVEAARTETPTRSCIERRSVVCYWSCGK